MKEFRAGLAIRGGRKGDRLLFSIVVTSDEVIGEEEGDAKLF